jgi:diguanylate cyclase (GGDEF)-like protein
MGDNCLQQVAGALSACARRPADVLARYGGEEFAAILPETDLQGAMIVAEDMRRAIEDLGIPHEASPANHVTISVGVAATANASRLRQLVPNADAALYRSKSGGRNKVTSAPPTSTASAA